MRLRLPAVALAAALLAPLVVAASAAQAAPDHDAVVAADCQPPNPATPKRQLRAEWLASVANIDWPSATGLSAEQQQAELVGWYDDAVAQGLNAVVVQVRPTADAFWPSPFEPWSAWLSGTQGTDPGYDPLGFAVAEAHKRNLEFHAWFNPYRVSMTTDVNALVPDHPARTHPDWLESYGGKLYYNPGVPQVRQFVEDAIMDAVTRYDMDGVHFDDYFYPYPVEGQTFADQDTYEQYGGDFDNIADWRRDNVDLLISELGSRIHAAKPWVEFGVSPFAVWRNAGTDPAGSPTEAGVETYDDLYADTRKWVREQWIDYITPQVYWNIGFAVADYAKIVPWWASVVEGTDVSLYIGQANHKVGNPDQPAAWSDPAEMSKHLTFNRDHPQVRGDIYFSATQVRTNKLDHMGIVRADHYTRPALPPAHVGGTAPAAPTELTTTRTPEGASLSWTAGAENAAFAVYRVDGNREITECDLVDGTNLVTTLRAVDGTQSFTDASAAADQPYTYVVTALNHFQTESAPGNSAPVT